MGRTHEPSLGVLEVEHAGGRSLDAHLLLDGRANDAVDRAAELARSIGQELRHHEQADALGALGRTGQASEHQVHDVVGEVVLAVGDEDLGARDGVAAVVQGLGLRGDDAHVRAGVRLGKAHGARPLGGDQLGQIRLLELVGGVRVDRVHRAERQARAHTPRETCAVRHLIDRELHALGQTLTAEVRTRTDGAPATFTELCPGFLEAGSRGDHAVLPLRAVLVAHHVERGNHVVVELGTLSEDGVDHVLGGICEATLRVFARGIEDLVQKETDVTQRGFVVRHRVNSPADGCLNWSWRPSNRVDGLTGHVEFPRRVSRACRTPAPCVREVREAATGAP